MEEIACSQNSCKIELPITNVYTLYADLRLRNIVNRAYFIQCNAIEAFTASSDTYYKNGWNISTYANRTNDYTGNTSYLSATTSRTELIIAPMILIAHDIIGQQYTSTSFTLFGSHDSEYYSNVILYRLSFFDFYGDIVYDFIPCTRDSDGAYGLFELSTNTFWPVTAVNKLTLTYQEYNIMTGEPEHYDYSFQYPVGSEVTIKMPSNYSYGNIVIPKGAKTTSTIMYVQPESIIPTEDDFYVYRLY